MEQDCEQYNLYGKPILIPTWLKNMVADMTETQASMTVNVALSIRDSFAPIIAGWSNLNAKREILQAINKVLNLSQCTAPNGPIPGKQETILKLQVKHFKQKWTQEGHKK